MALGGRKDRKTQPGEIDAAWRRSLRAAIAGDWPAAETWLERIVEADSRDLDAYHALARLYRDQGAIGRAIRMHQNLLLRSELDPEGRAEAMLELARDFQAGGFLQRAAASYEEVLARKSRSAEAQLGLIEVSIALRDHARALALTRKYRRHDRNRARALEIEILLSQARARADEGDHDAARQAARRCLRRDPKCAAAHILLGELEAERGKTAKAVERWRVAAGIDPVQAPLLYPKIEAGYSARGKAADYEKMLRARLAEVPGDHAARIALARTLTSHGETPQALEEIARAIESAPDSFALRLEQGRQLLTASQDGEALKAYAELLELIGRNLHDLDSRGEG